MSFSERETVLIHNNTSISEGRKTFGEYDSLIPSSTNTEVISGSGGVTDTSIVIPVMEREQKLRLFLNKIMQSITASGIPTSLIIMDNSLTDRFLQEFQSRGESLKDTPVVNIIYHHDPRMTQTTLRNYAVRQLLPEESQKVGLWDSDIYSTKNTFQELKNIWKQLSNLDGIAPPLVGYTSGDIESILSQYKNIRKDTNLRTKTHMPGAIGEENGIWHGDVLRTTMMRGAFLVNKDFLDKIAQQNPNKAPWLEDFVVWQNVPFFIAARELGLDFGYAMTGNSVVAHDDNVDQLSVGYSLPYRRAETLKSLVMLMHRNEVYTEQGRKINSRFIRFNLDTISRVCKFNTDESHEMQDILLQVSELLSKTATPQDYTEAWKSIKSNIPDKYSEPVDEFIPKMAQDITYQRIKSIRSGNFSHPIYSI